MIEVEVLVDKINQMTSDELAQFLLTQRITGEQSNEHACPIANWIKRESGKQVSVGNYNKADGDFLITTGDWNDYGDWICHDFYPMSKGPADFIGSFDNGRYENLVTAYEEYD